MQTLVAIEVLFQLVKLVNFLLEESSLIDKLFFGQDHQSAYLFTLNFSLAGVRKHIIFIRAGLSVDCVLIASTALMAVVLEA
jgi:hypothetical protein